MKAYRTFTALAVLAVLASAPSHADWLRAESPNFVVYSKESESRLREQVVLLEDFDRLLRIVTTAGREPAVNKLHVYVVRGNRELQVVHRAGPEAAGFYLSSPHGIAAIVDSRAPLGKHEVLLHEYTHHFMSQYARGSYPAWYVEGIAEYFMTTQFDARYIEYGKPSRHRAGWVVDRAWLPMDRVLFGTAGGLSQEDGVRFYAQSWLATHYFFSTDERIAALRRYFGAVLRGADRRDAFETQTGFTPEQFESELRQYISHRRVDSRRFQRGSVDAPPPVAVTRLPRAARDLLLYEAALRIGLPADRQETYLAAIRNAAARHPADPFAQQVLAHAEAVYGDPAAAERLLDGLLAATRGDAQLLYLRGMRHYTAAENWEDSAGEMRIARQWFVRAHQADENHFPTLYRYAHSLRRDASYTSENTANVLLLAHDLAPQVVEISVLAADVLMRRQDYHQAEAVLTPLATHPHDSKLAEWASEQIERVRVQAQEGL
jgi:hypothetical protein